MEGKLAKLPEMVDIKLVKNSKVEAILLEIINASSIEIISTDKKKAKVESVQKEKSTIKTKKVTKKKVSKKKSRFAKKEQAKSVKEKTPSTKTDKFGSRIGSNRAAINACLTKKAKTMKELLKESKLESTYYNHLAKLIKNGFVEKTDKGYKIA